MARTPAQQLRRRVLRYARSVEPALAAAYLRAYEVIRTSLSPSEITQLLSLGAGADRVVAEIAALPDLNRMLVTEVGPTLNNSTINAGARFSIDLPTAAARAGVRGGIALLNPNVIEGLAKVNSRMFLQVSRGVQETLRQTIQRGLEAGVNNREIARGLRKIIGLSPTQEAAVENFERLLREGKLSEIIGAPVKPPGIVGRRAVRPRFKPPLSGRRLRDPRFDGTLRKAFGPGGKGLSNAQVAKMKAAYLRRMRAFNANTQARSAALEATRRGQRLSFEDAFAKGLVKKEETWKRRRTVGDSRVRAEHDDIDGEPQPFDEPYSNGEMVSGDASHNCRCSDEYFQRKLSKQIASGPISAPKISPLSGQILTRTPKGLKAVRAKASRRTTAWNMLVDGQTYEEALSLGINPGDLTKLTRSGHLEWAKKPGAKTIPTKLPPPPLADTRPFKVFQGMSVREEEFLKKMGVRGKNDIIRLRKISEKALSPAELADARTLAKNGLLGTTTDAAVIDFYRINEAGRSVLVAIEEFEATLLTGPAKVEAQLTLLAQKRGALAETVLKRNTPRLRDPLFPGQPVWQRDLIFPGPLDVQLAEARAALKLVDDEIDRLIRTLKTGEHSQVGNALVKVRNIENTLAKSQLRELEIQIEIKTAKTALHDEAVKLADLRQEWIAAREAAIGTAFADPESAALFAKISQTEAAYLEFKTTLRASPLRAHYKRLKAEQKRLGMRGLVANQEFKLPASQRAKFDDWFESDLITNVQGRNARKARNFVQNSVHKKWTQGVSVRVNNIGRSTKNNHLRAYKSGNAINMAQESDIKSYVHELGHVMDEFNDELLKAAEEFYRFRTLKRVGISDLESLGFSDTTFGEELARADEFFDSYVGKIYMEGGGHDILSGAAVRASEILSMGLQEMYRNPLRFYQRDYGHFMFILELMEGRIPTIFYGPLP